MTEVPISPSTEGHPIYCFLSSSRFPGIVSTRSNTCHCQEGETHLDMSETTPSPSHTAVDLNDTNHQGDKLAKAEQGRLTDAGGATAPVGDVIVDEKTGAEHKLSKGRKWFLLLVFSVAQVKIFHHDSFCPKGSVAERVDADSTSFLFPNPVPRRV